MSDPALQQILLTVFGSLIGMFGVFASIPTLVEEWRERRKRRRMTR